MKEIFDWLREQLKDKSEVCYRTYLKLKSDEDFGCSFAYSHAIDLINEAEAKWEADCCEWKLSRTRLRKFEEYMWVTSCNNGNEIFGIPHWIVKNYNVCPYCEKRIQIVEVE